MSGKRIEAKHKISRRLGANLWGGKSPFDRRNYAPGQHGQHRKKLSGYGQQLTAKQKLKGYYGNIGERQFRRIYADAVRRRGDSSKLLIQLLERRLDAVVYRMKFAASPFAARQFVNHGHILVNGKRVNIGSYRVDEGDVIEVKPKSKQLAAVLTAMAAQDRTVPDYLQVDEASVKGTFVRAPDLEEVPYPVQMEPHLVIEFYSR